MFELFVTCFVCYIIQCVLISSFDAFKEKCNVNSHKNKRKDIKFIEFLQTFWRIVNAKTFSNNVLYTFKIPFGFTRWLNSVLSHKVKKQDKTRLK